MGGMQSARSATTPLSLPFSSQPQKPVISTEAAHGLIVSSAAEKSASLPKQHLSHCRVFAVALVFDVAFACASSPSTNQRVPHPSRLCDGRDEDSPPAEALVPAF
jgi:hypothetical protein